MDRSTSTREGCCDGRVHRRLVDLDGLRLGAMAAPLCCLAAGMGCRSCGLCCLLIESGPSGGASSTPSQTSRLVWASTAPARLAMVAAWRERPRFFERWWFERLFCIWRRAGVTFDTAIYGRPAPLRTADSSAPAARYVKWLNGKESVFNLTSRRSIPAGGG